MATRVECYYGQSGVGKSEAAAAVIEQIYEETGKSSRVIVGDGSRGTYADRGLVDAGVVEIVDYSLRPWPVSTYAKLCEGYWPEDVDDPNSRLIAPKPEDLKKLGVFVNEGLSVGTQYLMGDMKGGLSEQAGRGIKIGQDSPVLLRDVITDDKGKVIDGPRGERGEILVESFGGNALAHYGFVQRRMLANIERTKVFPGIVIWTAHERGAQDKITGEKLVGPEAGGEALTANLARHFNNTLHFVTATKKTDKKKDAHTGAMVADVDAEYRIYTRDHFHPDGATFVKYKAVTRGVSEVEGMPQFLTSDVPGKAMIDFYKKIHEIREARVAKLKALAKAG